MSVSRVFNWRMALLLSLMLAGIMLPMFLKGHITSEMLVQYKTIMAGYALEHWVTAVVGYLFAYIIIASLSLPFIGVLSAGAGYLFGLGLGAALAIFGLAIGTVCGFLFLRFLVAKDSLKESKGHYQVMRYQKLSKVLSRHGIWMLLFLNGVVMLPAFAINLIALFNQMSWWTVTWTAVVGGLPYLVFNMWIGHQLRIAGSEIFLKMPYHHAVMAVVIFCLILMLLWYLLGVIRMRLNRYLERVE